MIQQILKQKQRFQLYQESGYTILEGLVAMIMVAALMAAVAPVIAFSVGTRVQARRVELAAQAARSYIDAVRTGQLNPPNGFADDRALTASPLSKCSQINGKNELQYCQSPLIVNMSGEFYCVDNDNNDDNECTPDSLTDMMVHGAIDARDVPNSYRNQIEAADLNTKKQLGYKLRVRVYRAKAFLNGATLSNEGVPFTVNNSGLATRDGERERPLFVTETEIAPTQDLFQNYRNRIE